MEVLIWIGLIVVVGFGIYKLVTKDKDGGTGTGGGGRGGNPDQNIR